MLPKGERNWVFSKSRYYIFSFKIKHEFKKKGGERDEWTIEQNLHVFSWFQDCHHQKGGDCGSNAFQVYFGDAKDSSQESRVKQVSRIKESFNQDSRLKWRFKRRLKIYKNFKKSIKTTIKWFFQKKRLNSIICPKEFFKEKSFTKSFTLW